MKSLFCSLLYASVIGGIGAALAGKAYRRHIQALAALLCTALLISPLFGALPDLNLSAAEYESAASVDGTAYRKLLIKQTKEDAEKAIGDYIFSKTGIKTNGLCISFESKDEEITLTHIRAEAETASEAERVKALLTADFGDTVTVEVICEG